MIKGTTIIQDFPKFREFFPLRDSKNQQDGMDPEMIRRPGLAS